MKKKERKETHSDELEKIKNQSEKVKEWQNGNMVQ